MKDLERIVRESLRSVGESYTPTDETAARARFVRRRRRRNWTIFGSSTALAAATVAALVFVAAVAHAQTRELSARGQLLDREAVVLDFGSLGFAEDTREAFIHQLEIPHGIILVTGPTGSGKTTTLYTALSLLNKPAARQMLVYHYTYPPGSSGQPDPLRGTFATDLAAVGDWPSQPRLTAIANGSDNGAGQGLKNIRRRAESIEGSFELRSWPGRGTALEVMLRA